MNGDHFDVGRDGVTGGVGKLVTIRGATYRLVERLRHSEKETEYAAVNVVTGLRRFIIKLYPPGLSDSQIREDAKQRLESVLTLKAHGLPVARADVVPSSCGLVRLMCAMVGKLDGERECTELLECASAALGRGDVPAALATCDAIVAVNPCHADAMALRAQSLLTKSDPPGALQLIREVVKLEPNDERFHHLHMRCALASGHIYLATLILADQIERAPGDIYAAERLVELLLHELRVDAAEQIVKRYRDLLPPEAAAHYFKKYDADVSAAWGRVALVEGILQMQQDDHWMAAHDAWQPLIGAGQIAYLNLETCRYHLGQPLDLRGLLQLTLQSNAMIRSVALTLALLGAARLNDLALGTIAARSTKAMFSQPMDLCGVPIWTLWDRQVSGRPEPIVVALRKLEAASPEGEARELFTWVARHYDAYARQIGSRPRILSTLR